MKWMKKDLSSVHVAQVAACRPEQVFKTLVLKGEHKGPMVCVIPVELEVDLKKLAHVSGDKKVECCP